MKIYLSYFPYKLREGQEDFASYVYEKVKDGNVVVNAPTGFGKTSSILSSLLPASLRRGRKIIWAVRTGNETDRPIEELKAVRSFTGGRVFGLSYRGKKDMCLLLRDLKLRGVVEHDDVSFLCKARQKDCKYLINYQRFFVPEDFVKAPKLYSEVLDYCEEREICPYRLQADLAPYADVIALSYNYIIDEDISWAMRTKIDYGSSFLVVDEAHNLEKACSSLNSDQITLTTIRSAIKELKDFNTARAQEAKEFLNKMLTYFKEAINEVQEEDSELNVKHLVERCSKNLRSFEAMVRAVKGYGMMVRRRRLEEGKAPRSSLHRLGSFWASVLENLDVEGVAFLLTKDFQRGRENLIIELWDMRSRVILKDKWGNFHRCIFCSGTINPVEAFAETIGLEKYYGKVFPSTFTKENSLSLIIKDLSTEGEELNEGMAKSYLSMIEGFLKSLEANIAIFSASYRIQNTLLKHGLKEALENNNRRFFLEQQGMSGRLARRVLDGFKACAYSGEKGVLCATMTGRFAEGADFPGKELEGIFLVGIPFDKISTRTRLYLEYYRSIYGKEKGTFYGYILPAVRRASQSLGRALRSKEDRAVFILGDVRYRRFINLLPDFVQKNYKIIDRKLEVLNKEVEEFWEGRS